MKTIISYFITLLGSAKRSCGMCVACLGRGIIPLYGEALTCGNCAGRGWL